MNFSRTLSSSTTNGSRDIIISRFQDGESLKVSRRRLRANIRNLFGKNVDNVLLEYHNSLLVFLIACTLAEEINLDYFCNFWTSATMTLDQVI